jgi:tetratricopeptide (TPR) repeat protein
MDPENADIHCALGILWSDMGKHDEAIHYLTEAARLAPKDPYPLVRRAEEYRVKGNEASAEDDFRRAIKIDPTLVSK